MIGFILFSLLILNTFWAQDTMQIGISDWPPFMFADEENPRGISVDLVEENFPKDGGADRNSYPPLEPYPSHAGKGIH